MQNFVHLNITLVSICNGNVSIEVQISIIIWMNDELNDKIELTVHVYLLNLLTWLKGKGVHYNLIIY